MFELDNPYQAFPVSTSFKRYLGFLNRCFLLCYDQIGRLVYIVSTTIWLQHSSKFLSERNLDSAHGRRRSRSDFVCVPLGGFGEVSESDAALRARPSFRDGRAHAPVHTPHPWDRYSCFMRRQAALQCSNRLYRPQRVSCDVTQEVSAVRRFSLTAFS
jgi:hypothetical protein